MKKFPIGVMLESFKLPTDEAIKAAASLGAQGIQMYATKGDKSPENLNAQARRDLLAKVKDHGMVFSAICGDLGKGFHVAERNPELIEKSKRIWNAISSPPTSVWCRRTKPIPVSL